MKFLKFLKIKSDKARVERPGQNRPTGCSYCGHKYDNHCKSKVVNMWNPLLKKNTLMTVTNACNKMGCDCNEYKM